MMYLYVGSIVAIMCIYISVLLDQCPSLTGRSSREPLTGNGDPESGSVTSFGTLRRAHIDRNKVSRTSFYLRVGALGKFQLKRKKSFYCICVWKFEYWLMNKLPYGSTQPHPIFKGVCLFLNKKIFASRQKID